MCSGYSTDSKRVWALFYLNNKSRLTVLSGELIPRLTVLSVELIPLLANWSVWLANTEIYVLSFLYKWFMFVFEAMHSGTDSGGGAHPARAPAKIGKNMIFWRKIVIFHMKNPKIFRASLHSAQFFLSAPP